MTKGEESANTMESSLSQEISYNSHLLMKIVTNIQAPQRILKVIDGTGGKVSVAELIAYQIGWGKCLIRWYETGIQGEQPAMPGEGFLKWNYVAIAKHFYQKFLYDASSQQLEVFREVVSLITGIVQKEQRTGNLDLIGIWSWCTLPSGKRWPLSKWIQVNTVSPYKRAIRLLNSLRVIPK